MRAALVLVLLLAQPLLAPDVEPYAHLAGAGGLDAAQVADAYGAAALHAAGVDGAGVRVGIVTWGPADAAALDAYADANGLPRGGLVHHGDCPAGSALAEWDLDVQMARAMAPRATLDVYCAPAARFADLLAAVEAAVADGVDVLVQSWGACEDRVPAATAAAFRAAYARAAARGVAVFAASGDGGSRECTRWSVGEQALRTSWPATDPLVVAVGGTTLVPGEPEVAWNACAPCPDAEWLASGGGLSVLHAAPWWQEAGPRASPDAAAVADAVAVFTGGTWRAMRGTSASAPLWAGAWALVAPAPGSPGPLLYAAPAAAWNDVTLGSNGDYAAGPGHDLATGLGTPDLAALRAHLAALPPAPAPVASRGPERGEVRLGWAPVAGATYVVLRGDVAGDEAPLAEVVDNAFVDAGLGDARVVSYRVAAKRDGLVGPASLPVEGRTFAPPSAPSPVSWSLDGARVVLAWDAPADDGGLALRYRVWRAPLLGAPVLAGETEARAFVDEGCLGACAYAVSAVNAVGEGPRSPEALAPGAP